MSSPSRELHAGATVRIGRFRCAPDEPMFVDSGPTRGHLLVFPRETVTITHTGRRPVVADPTRAMIYNRGQEYRRDALSPAGDRCEWFAFPAQAVLAARRAHGHASDDEERPFGDAMHAPVDARTYLLARLVFAQVSGARPPDPLLVEEASLTLLDRVVAAEAGAPAAAETPARAHRELARAAERLLAARFAEPLALPALAEALATSPFHLARVFRRVTGRSLHAWRTQLRLRAALEHLCDGRDDLTRIALELGFSSHSHFTAAFRAAYGVAPSRLRQLPARALSTILTA